MKNFQATAKDSLKPCYPAIPGNLADSNTSCGINNLSVFFTNKTDFPLEELTAKVIYIKNNGKHGKQNTSLYLIYLRIRRESNYCRK